MTVERERRIAGILLAAGRGVRFGSAKLLAPLSRSFADVAAGTPLGAAACRHLVAALSETIAVIRPGDAALFDALQREGARVVKCARADEGMGASLACGVASCADADGWVVALADMPWISSQTIASVADALRTGAGIVAPSYAGTRGHPVGFSRRHYAALAALSGDEGARGVVAAHAGSITLLSTDDPGVVRDVDTPGEL